MAEPLEHSGLIRSAATADEVPGEDVRRESDVLILGENHMSLSSPQWITDNIPRLKAAGVTHIAFESLEVPEEKAVNQYLEGRRDTVPVNAIQLVPGREGEMASLYRAMKAAGMRVVALQKPFLEWVPKFAKLAARNTGMPREMFMDPEKLMLFISRVAELKYVPGLNEAVAELAITLRNKFMAHRLAAKLGKGEKAVVLAGYAHLGHPEGLGPEKIFRMPPADYGNLTQELKSVLLRSFSLSLTGGLFLSPDYATRDRKLKEAEYRLLNRKVNNGKPVYEPAPKRYEPTSERSAIYHLGGPILMPPQAQMPSESWSLICWNESSRLAPNRAQMRSIART